MVHEPIEVALPRPDRHLQCVQGEIGAKRPGGLPAHDEPAVDVDHERDVDEAGPGGDVGEVRDPQLVGPGRREVSLDQIHRSGRGLIGCGGLPCLPPSDPFQPQLTHEALHGAASEDDPFAVQLSPDLAAP